MSFSVTITTHGGAMERLHLHHATSSNAMQTAAKKVDELVKLGKLPLDANLVVTDDDTGQDACKPMTVETLLLEL